MNPYQPPLSKDEAPLPGPLMQLRYGRFYTWFLAGIAVMVTLPNAILAWAKPDLLKPLLMVLPSGLVMLWLAWETRKAVLFEVFEDRLEFPSLGFKRLRWKKPLHRRTPRWWANREDLAKFEAWRQTRGVKSLGR